MLFVTFFLSRPVVGYPVMFHACKIDPPVAGISRYIQYWATQVMTHTENIIQLSLAGGSWRSCEVIGAGNDPDICSAQERGRGCC